MFYQTTDRLRHCKSLNIMKSKLNLIIFPLFVVLGLKLKDLNLMNQLNFNFICEQVVGHGDHLAEKENNQNTIITNSNATSYSFLLSIFQMPKKFRTSSSNVWSRCRCRFMAWNNNYIWQTYRTIFMHIKNWRTAGIRCGNIEVSLDFFLN